MAFNIILQKNTSERETVDKSITDIATLPCNIKANTSIIDPVFIIDDAGANVLDSNYLTCETFMRSYFITNIVSIRKNIWEISCHVDVLSSFKVALRNLTAVVSRQENIYNLYLDDGTFKSYQNPMILTKAFPSGFNTQEFILVVSG